MHSLTVLLKKERSLEVRRNCLHLTSGDVLKRLKPSSTHQQAHFTQAIVFCTGRAQAAVRLDCISVNTRGAALGLDSFMQLPVPQQREGPGGRGRGAIARRTQVSLGYPGLQPHRQRPSWELHALHTHTAERSFTPRPLAEAPCWDMQPSLPYCVSTREPLNRSCSQSSSDSDPSASVTHWQKTRPYACPHEQSAPWVWGWTSQLPSSGSEPGTHTHGPAAHAGTV